MKATPADTRHHPIPPGLDEMEPGPELAAWLSAIEVGQLSGHDRIIVLRAHQRLVSHFQAKVYADMAAVGDVLIDGSDPKWGHDAAATEIRAALCLTRRTADAEFSFALDLQRRLPAVFDLLSSGGIDLRRARTIDRHTIDLPVATARAIADRVLDEAPHLTTGELAARLGRLRIDVEPREAAGRLSHAVAERRVVMEPTPDGTAHLHAYDLPPDRAAAIMDRLDHAARRLRRDGETRTMDQLRTDVLIDVLDGSTSTTSCKGRRAVVDLHVDLTTLIGLTERAGDIAGYGPVVADIARQVAEQQDGAEWRFTVHDGQGIAAVGVTRRRPAVSTARAVSAAHPRCVFPGCRVPAARCDLDHTMPWFAGGPTLADNLAPLCRHDHRMRHEGDWSYHIADDGVAEWRSPLGHTYRKRRGEWDRPP